MVTAALSLLASAHWRHNMPDGYSVSCLTGRIAAGEPDMLWTPRTPRTGKRGVILCHAYTFIYTFLDGTVSPHAVQIAAYLARHGIYCISGQMGNADSAGDNWGNDQAMARVTSAWSVLQSLGCATDQVALVGISMGGATASRYAMLNPNSVSAVYGIMPVSDLNDTYNNNRVNNAQASLSAAWGVVAPAALPAGADLIGQAPLAAQVPCRLDYGSADTTVIPSTVAALAAAWGKNCVATVTDTTNNHGDNLIASTSPKDILGFLMQYGGC